MKRARSQHAASGAAPHEAWSRFKRRRSGSAQPLARRTHVQRTLAAMLRTANANAATADVDKGPLDPGKPTLDTNKSTTDATCVDRSKSTTDATCVDRSKSATDATSVDTGKGATDVACVDMGKGTTGVACVEQTGMEHDECKQSADRPKLRKVLLPEPGSLWYARHIVPVAACGGMLEAILRETRPAELTVKLFGKDIVAPRLQSAHGDTGLAYQFTGVRVIAKPWTPTLARLRSVVEDVTGERFNFCLVNVYRGPGHYIGYHSDDERNLVPGSSIAGITLGEARRMTFKRKSDGRVTALVPAAGSLYVIRAPTNRLFKHAIPASKKHAGTRVSLTFRRMKV